MAIKATVLTQGPFMAGSEALFFFTFSDIDGLLFDPVDITITILDSLSTTVDTFKAADRLEKGQYAFIWDVPSTQTPGLYSIRVDYVKAQVGGNTSATIVESFAISESDVGFIEPQVIGFRNFVEALIGYAQRIPIFHEIGRLNPTNTTADFTFERWNQPAGVKVFLNGNLMTSGYSVNYLKGNIVFSDVLSLIDEVQASYTFRWFTDGELDAFIAQAVEVFNQYPPHSIYKLITLPPRNGVTVAHQAAVFALRRLIMDLHFQEPAKIFGGMDRADKLIGSLDNLKKNMEEEINELYKQKAKGPYLGLTKTVTVPEFTLPGGRCLAENSIITYRKSNILLPYVYTTTSTKISEHLNVCTIPCDYQEGTISELYNLFDNEESIEVLSDKDGILTFEKVSNIWKSGTKPLLRIEDEYNNAVEVSDEHIMFVDNKEVPASQVKIGDILTVNLFNSIKESEVTKITRIKETFTFDIEVPTTENLMVNNIKCHNSRWFRYLFKGA